MIGGKEHKHLSLDWAYPLAAALCASVQSIHRAGVVHRDLSPENVMYGFGSGMEVRLIDFDSAKMHGANLSRAELAETGANGDVAGKVKYTSPEQWQDFDSAGVESDAYSVGVMIWEMITGSPPFKGSAVDEIREQHLAATRDFAELTRSGVPGQLAMMLAGLLDPDRSRRPQLDAIRARILAEIGGAGE
jgi:serine/threonine-protein kinase